MPSNHDPLPHDVLCDTIASCVDTGAGGMSRRIAFPRILLAEDASSFMTSEAIIADGARSSAAVRQPEGTSTAPSERP
jgi:hypothetical protein